MFQIIFNEISASEISQLSFDQQIELLNEFQVTEDDLENLQEKQSDDKFGKIVRDGKTLYRYRAKDMRIYFEPDQQGVVIHRVLHRNSFQDFLYRAELPMGEDEALSQSKSFWELIEEGEKASRQKRQW